MTAPSSAGVRRDSGRLEVHFAGRDGVETWRDQLSILQFAILRTAGNQRCLISTEFVLLLLHYAFNHSIIHSMAQQPLVGHGLLFVDASRSHSLVLFWTRGQPDAGTSTRQYVALTRDKHPCLRLDSNPRS
jgi:hypothetical protein